MFARSAGDAAAVLQVMQIRSARLDQRRCPGARLFENLSKPLKGLKIGLLRESSKAWSRATPPSSKKP